MNQHTPGPWHQHIPPEFDDHEEVEDGDGCHSFISGKGWGSFARVVIKMESESNHSEVGLANLRLILKAPELYQELNQAALELGEASKLLKATGLISTSDVFTRAVDRIEFLLTSIDTGVVVNAEE